MLPPPPERLLRFGLATWPGEGAEARWRAWRAARAAYATGQDGGDPDAEVSYFGNWLDRMRDEREALITSLGLVCGSTR